MATLSVVHNNEPTTNANATKVDMKLEVVIIPVSDVDRAKEFYARLVSSHHRARGRQHCTRICPGA